MKMGFWMRDFHVLQTEVQVMMDLMGRRRKTWVRISGGKLSDIATSYKQRERETHFETATGEESESTRWVGFDVKPEGSAASECERLSERKPKKSQGIDSRLK